jgi:small subunit ribosomal protein S13
MVRILGHTPHPDQPLISFIASIYGLGKTLALPLIVDLGFRPFVRVSNLTEKDWATLRPAIEGLPGLERSLRKREALIFRNLARQGSFRSSRLLRGLPLRGQSGRTNGATARALNRGRLPANFRHRRKGA